MPRLFTVKKTKSLLLVIVIKVRALPSRCRPPRPAGAAATGGGGGGFLLGGDEVDDGCDDGAVLGLPVLPVHRRRVPDLLLQQGVQLFLQALGWKREFKSDEFLIGANK